MEKFSVIINSIDWLFAFVILVAGRYWGKNFFKLCKNDALNFLVFATAFGIMWLIIKYLIGELHKSAAANLFLTYLFVTSFYEVLGQKIFEYIEGWFPKKSQS